MKKILLLSTVALLGACSMGTLGKMFSENEKPYSQTRQAAPSGYPSGYPSTPPGAYDYRAASSVTATPAQPAMYGYGAGNVPTAKSTNINTGSQQMPQGYGAPQTAPQQAYSPYPAQQQDPYVYNPYSQQQAPYGNPYQQPMPYPYPPTQLPK
jgi:hypothetical protein